MIRSAVPLDFIVIDEALIICAILILTSFQILNVQNEPLWNDWQELKKACTEDPQAIMNIILKAKVRHPVVNFVEMEHIKL